MITHKSKYIAGILYCRLKLVFNGLVNSEISWQFLWPWIIIWDNVQDLCLWIFGDLHWSSPNIYLMLIKKSQFWYSCIYCIITELLWKLELQINSMKCLKHLYTSVCIRIFYIYMYCDPNINQSRRKIVQVSQILKLTKPSFHLTIQFINRVEITDKKTW